MNDTVLSYEPIGRVHTCYPEKFGIPRQPGLVRAATGWVELFPQFAREEMVKGLESFSHIWLLFLFHDTVGEGWKATVRPPRLGGQKRVGIWASRSPHRPNHLGMSVVRLDGIRLTETGVCLDISGVDLLDNTPLVDLKPYIPYSDSIANAECGYARDEFPESEVVFTEEVELFCKKYQEHTGRNLRELVLQSLSSDPRPASQRKVSREYGMLLWNVNVRWRVVEGVFEVFSCAENDLLS